MTETDSSSCSSLLALVDIHLKKVSLQDNNANSKTSINIPLLNSLQNSSVSESQLSMHTRPRFPIPTLSTNESPIQSILAKQVANMLVAKEKKQQEEEKQRLEEEMKRLKLEEEKQYEIDLMQAIQAPYNPKPRTVKNKQDIVSKSNSIESLFKLNITNCDAEPERTKTPEPVLPCITDMSYILKQKVKKAKCSSFGKVLAARQRCLSAPYIKEKIPTNIVMFDFSTPSPCDIARENRKYKPTMSTPFTFDITKFV